MKMTMLSSLCAAAMFSLASQASAAIMINEVDADTAGTDMLEFVELFGDPNMPLDGISIVGVNGSDDLTYDSLALDLDGFSTDADGYFLIGNVDVPGVDIVVPSNAVQNGQDAIVLFTGDIADFPNDTAPPTGAAVLDVVHYGTNDSIDSGLVALYPGLTYVDEGTLGNKDAHSVGRLPNGMGAFVTLEAPTPGASNDLVPEPASIALALLGVAAVAGRRRNS